MKVTCIPYHLPLNMRTKQHVSLKNAYRIATFERSVIDYCVNRKRLTWKENKAKCTWIISYRIRDRKQQFPKASTILWNDVIVTFMRRHYVALVFIWHQFHVICLLGRVCGTNTDIKYLLKVLGLFIYVIRNLIFDDCEIGKYFIS